MIQKVGVIDIGSNTIKLLVASGNSTLQCEHNAIEECRISTGIADHQPILKEESMQRSIAAVKRLVAIAHSSGATRIQIVATSAVRDAKNGLEFADKVKLACGQPVEILSGRQEAEHIAFGLRFDSSILANSNYLHFDLGGGSMEFNEITEGNLQRSLSMPLGAVRLTEMFIPDPHQPISSTVKDKIEQRVWQTLKKERIPIPCPETTLVFTGGSATISRVLIEEKTDLSHNMDSHPITLAQMENLYQKLSTICFNERLNWVNLPQNRADVVCAALLVLIVLMKYCKKTSFQHSLFTLRHGLAAQTLNL